LVDAVWHSTQAADRLVVAASRLIRELDAVAPGKRIVVHANRGLAGLDGTISTAVGVALAHSSGPGGGDAATSRAGVTRLLTGDLAFLHDVGGLALGDGEERPPLLVIVGNDGGGTIFDELEVAQSRRPRPAPAQNALSRYDRVMLTPQTASIELLVRAYGWEYRRVESCDDLDAAISACFGPTVVEVPLAR
jgi:2-succinyl-5-enolpyruvyl-6-hydroxy-3-cyclohexene-1-carboxylate synthase